MIRPKELLLVGLSVVLCLGAGAVRAQVPTCVSAEAIAGQIEQKLTEKFTATNLRAEVMPFDDPFYTQQGRVQWVLFSAEVLAQKPVTIRDVFIKCLDVTLDLEKLFAPNIDVVKKSLGRSIIGARLTEDDLNVMIGPESPLARQSGLENLKMTLSPGEIKITGRYRPLFGSDIELTGTLEVEDHSKINFIPTGAKLNGMPLPSGILKGVLKRLNPLIDFQTVPLSPSIDEVTVLDHEVRVIG